jgi:6-phosphogluconolactonase/glucosamine-6-phosphate isomerase/deaminase
MFLIAGTDKAAAVANLVEGDASIPASHVRRDGTVLLLDEAAAASIPSPA